MISYNPLWKTMKDNEVTTYQLIQKGIDKRTIHNLKHNKNVTVLTIEKLCNILECKMTDIVEFINNDK